MGLFYLAALLAIFFLGYPSDFPSFLKFWKRKKKRRLNVDKMRKTYVYRRH